jgi:hypothetical protein
MMDYLISKFTVAAFTIMFGICLMCQPCSAQEKSSCPEGWERVNAKDHFTFCLPPGMKQSNARGMESFFREYTREKLRVIFNYDPYDFLLYDKRHESDMLNYKEEEIRLDGKRANIRTYQINENGRARYEAHLHVGEWQKSSVDLEMFVAGDNPEAIEIAQKIFRSVDFPEEKRKH